MLDHKLSVFCKKILKPLASSPKLLKIDKIPGGCTHEVLKLSTQQANYLIKWSASVEAVSMFECEREGLERLATAGLYVPEVLAQGKEEEGAYLLLSYISPGAASDRYWEQLGEQLAQLHTVTQAHFGLEKDNFIGALVQKNQPSTRWADFLIEQRFRPLVSSPPLPLKTVRAMESLYLRLHSLLPDRPASLLHGDLWSGNLLCSTKGQVCWIDPAIYYGDAEMDLALALLFGGFSPRFFKSYQFNHPLQPEWKRRVDVYILYHLLVHVHLFGESYIPSLQKRLKAFT